MMKAEILRQGLAFLATAAAPILVHAQPTAPTPERSAELRAMLEAERPVAAEGGTLTGFVVDPASREESRTFYRTVFTASSDLNLLEHWLDPDGGSPAPVMDPSHAYTNGDAGDTTPGYGNAVQRRINYFRAMAGIPATITFNATFSAKAQEAALMMSANDQLNHFPPNSWTFWTADGREAAENSNLAIGSAGPESVVGYMQDHGAGNAAVGHRRWLLYPQTEVMGTGDVPGHPDFSSRRPANAIWVFDGNFGSSRPSVRDTFVAWPPPGFVPFDLVYPRWSISHPGANFSGATVTMKRDGADIAVVKETLSTGIGETTLVWVYDGLNANNSQTHSRPGADTTYSVVVDGVTLNGQNQKWEYDVIVFDPDEGGGDFVATMVSGSSTPVVGADNAYAVAMADFATGLQWRSLQLGGTTDVIEGAESGTSTVQITSTPGYDVIVTNPRFSGSHAFNLRHSGSNQVESVRLNGVYLAAGDSEFSMRQRLAAVTDDETAAVQLSFDGGGSWKTIWEHKAAAQEGSFSLETVSLAEFAGSTFELRVVFSIGFGGWFNGTQVGWYFDDLRLTKVAPVTIGTPSSTIDGNDFTYNPPVAGDFALQARPVFYTDYPLDWGPVFPVTAEVGGPVAPVITNQPGNLLVNEGGVAQFSVTATGNPVPTFQWKKGDQEINGATSSVLNFPSAQTSDAGTYTVVVSNEAGSVTSDPSILTVVRPPVITADPAGGSFDPGAQVLFSVTVDGSPPYAYQWTKDGVDIDGASGSTLQLSQLEPDDAGAYAVRVSNNAGNATSAAADLAINVSANAGAYFGSLEGDAGTFALWVRGSGTAVLIVHLNSAGDGLVEHNLAIDPDGSFTLQVPEGIGPITGQITGESVAGTIAGLSLDFSGTKSDPDGAFAGSAGFFPMAVAEESGGTLDVIVGADGRAIVFVPGENESDTLSGSLTGGGQLSGTSFHGVELTLNLGTNSVSGTFSGPGGESGVLGGYREGVGTPHLLANISMRGTVGTGSGIMIAGFVVDGSGDKPILVRAVGPTLASFGVDGTIPDPQLLVSILGGVDIEGNDNWEDFVDLVGLDAVGVRVGAFPLGPGEKDSALILGLVKGSFTARVSGVNSSTGISLVEVYDANEFSTGLTAAKLSNISMRGTVGTGGSIMIAGFVIEAGFEGDPGVPKRVLIRGVGPTLGGFGVQGTISDPLLRLFDGANLLIAENDNWEEGADVDVLTTAMATVGAFDLDPGAGDAALLIWLLPGKYTAQVRGVNNATGLALVEVYAVP